MNQIYIVRTTVDEQQLFIKQKLTDYLELSKFRLNLFVVITSCIGYFLAGGTLFSWDVVVLFLGGFFVTASANTLNQIIEKDTDKLMPRTAKRPLSAERMKISEAVLFAGITSVVGLILLGLFNTSTAFLGALSLVSYAFVYTPMKRYTSFSVFIGAFPGAFPPMIGVVAASGEVNGLAIYLFLIQFLWQFPHFWAIAWKAYDQYAQANFFLLPQSGGKTKQSAFVILLSSYTTILLGPIGYLLIDISVLSTTLISLLGVGFVYFSHKLYNSLEDKAALQLMFYSLFYLPLALAIVFIK